MIARALARLATPAIPSFHHAILAWSFILVLFSCGSEATDSTPSSAPKTAKIMPLGDSITESFAGLPTYRFHLWQLAQAHGYRIDFVGSRRGVTGGLPLHDGFDMDHEGHSGWRADEILGQISAWARMASPDVVLIHLGHNDLCQGQDVASTVAEVAAIIDVLRAVNAQVGVILAQVLASANACHVQIPVFNAALPAMVAAKSTAASPVLLADLFTGFIPATMTWDGLHPNGSGESWMADRWFAVLAPWLDTFYAGP
jgi:acyl-CoA thioesterase I